MIGLQFSNEIKLDPMAVALKYGVDIVEFVQLHRVVKDLKAGIRPLNESGLVVLVE